MSRPERDAALEAELTLAKLVLATTDSPRERRAAWAAICKLEDERDVRRDLERGPGTELPR